MHQMFLVVLAITGMDNPITPNRIDYETKTYTKMNEDTCWDMAAGINAQKVNYLKVGNVTAMCLPVIFPDKNDKPS